MLPKWAILRGNFHWRDFLYMTDFFIVADYIEFSINFLSFVFYKK
jgi:hypothetical protein